MCCGTSTANANTEMAPNDEFHSDDSGVSPDWATRAGPHRYIGIIMVIVMVLLAVGVWSTLAPWPRRRIRRWFGRGRQGCGENGCDHAGCGDEESQKKGLKDLKLKPSLPPGEAGSGGGGMKRGRSRRREERRGEKLEVEHIEYSRSSTTTMANTVFDERKLPKESRESSQTLSTIPTATTAAPPLPLPALPPPAHTFCRTRIRTPYAGSQPEQDSGRISRLSWHWLKRVGTPTSRCV